MPIYYYGGGGSTGVTPSNPKFLVVDIDTNTNLDIGTMYKVDCTSAAITVTLPEAIAYIGESIMIKKMDASANIVLIEPSVGNTVEMDGSLVISTQNSCIMLMSDGNDWVIVAEKQ